MPPFHYGYFIVVGSKLDDTCACVTRGRFPQCPRGGACVAGGSPNPWRPLIEGWGGRGAGTGGGGGQGGNWPPTFCLNRMDMPVPSIKFGNH